MMMRPSRRMSGRMTRQRECFGGSGAHHTTVRSLVVGNDAGEFEAGVDAELGEGVAQ